VIRNVVRSGESAVLMLTIMFVGSLGLWVGIPVGALFVGSRVQEASDSIALAMVAMTLMVIGSLVVLVPILGWLNHKYMEIRVARGRQDLGNAPLEGVIVVSAAVAVVAFVIWVAFFAGTAPFTGSQ
jgi:heme/copper-type cytochrome/quinol oxidase subunit 2